MNVTHGAGRGRGREGRGGGRQHARESKQLDTQGPPLHLTFAWGSQGEEEVFTAMYNSQKLVEVKDLRLLDVLSFHIHDSADGRFADQIQRRCRID